MKQITIDDVEIKVFAVVDDIPVGDDALDKEVENEILKRLDCWDIWAWASVEVKVTYKSLTHSSYLGGCSYESEQAFKEDPYYLDLVNECLESINEQVKELCEDSHKENTAIVAIASFMEDAIYQKQVTAPEGATWKDIYKLAILERNQVTASLNNTDHIEWVDGLSDNLEEAKKDFAEIELGVEILILETGETK